MCVLSQNQAIIITRIKDILDIIDTEPYMRNKAREKHTKLVRSLLNDLYEEEA